MPALEIAHTPEYELVTPGGRVYTRARYLALIAEAPFYLAWGHGPMQVLATETMGSVKYQAKLVFPSGKLMDCWHTDIYELRGLVWQAVWSQATQLPSEPAPGGGEGAA